MNTAPLQDLDLERAVIGGACIWPHAIETLAPRLTGSDFGSPEYGLAWEALVAMRREGMAIDTPALAARLQRPSVELLGWTIDCVLPRSTHADAITRLASARRLLGVCTETAQGVRDGSDPFAEAQRLAEAVEGLRTPVGTLPDSVQTFSSLIDDEEADAPWVIPGLAYQDTRIVMVADEGGGKSVLRRQLGCCASQGLHPFDLAERFDPVCVLDMDWENPRRELRRSGRWLRRVVKAHVGEFNDDNWHVWRQPGGGDIRSPRGKAELEAVLQQLRPKLVVGGPVYKLSDKRAGESDEELATSMVRLWDELRVRYGFALILEHHAAKGDSLHRDLRPYGSQRWLAWPDVGLALRKDPDNNFDVERNRGDRGSFDWPPRLVRTGDDNLLPWAADWATAA